MTSTPRPSIVPLEMAEFRFPDGDPLAGRLSVAMAYAVRHADGILLFDTGFGFGNAELDAKYHPRPRRLAEVLAAEGMKLDDIGAVVNCHLHVDHAGQNSALPGIPIYVQPAEWASAQSTGYTILEWVDIAAAGYRQIEGDHEVFPGIRVIATPGHTRGHQSLAVETANGLTVLAGQAVYSHGEWVGRPESWEGRTSAWDRAAYDGSIERLRGLEPAIVHFGHDRRAWTGTSGA